MTKIIVTFAMFISTVVFGQKQSETGNIKSSELFATFKPKNGFYPKSELTDGSKRKIKTWQLFVF